MALHPNSTSDLVQIQNAIADVNQKNGWRDEWDLARNSNSPGAERECALIVSEKLALIHSETSEALEAHRSNLPIAHYVTPAGVIAQSQQYDLLGNQKTAVNKPDGLLFELADVLIRTIDLIDMLDASAADLILGKHEYNEGRGYKHGGRNF